MNKKTKAFRSIVCILLSVLMVLSLILSVIPALAVDESELEKLAMEMALLELDAQAQQEIIDDLDSSKARFLDRKLALDAQIKLNQDAITLMEAQIRLYDDMISSKEQELAQAQEAEKTQSEQLRSRMRAMEEQNSFVSYAAVLMEASSLTDLLSRLADITDIMHYDKQLEETYMATRADVEALKAEYEEIQTVQEEARNQLDRKEAQLDAQIQAAYMLIANMDELAEDAEAEYAAIAADEERIQRELEELIAELARLEAERLAAQQAANNQYNNNYYVPTTGTGTNTGTGTTAGTTTGSTNTNTGTTSGTTSGTTGGTTSGTTSGVAGLIWPTDSSYISSLFGNRDAPTAGATSNHQALDIGAAAGTPIYAASSGTVQLAGANGGYGNTVFIDHGSGTSTLYAHMENYVVSPGEYVQQGQIIGYVGSTGIATGPHLHYEVRVDGEKVDPLQYYDSSGLTYSPTA